MTGEEKVDNSLADYYNKIIKKIILDSSMVEHTAVNRGVVGSSPTQGV